jgi:hypothetical protein
VRRGGRGRARPHYDDQAVILAIENADNLLAGAANRAAAALVERQVLEEKRG